MWILSECCNIFVTYISKAIGLYRQLHKIEFRQRAV